MSYLILELPLEPVHTTGEPGGEEADVVFYSDVSTEFSHLA